MVIGQQHRFDPFGVLTCFSDPSNDRLFFMPFDPNQTTDPIALGNQGQRIQYFFFPSPPSIEKGPFRLGEGLAASLTFVPLPPPFGLTKLDNVVVSLTLAFAVI